MTFVIVEPCIDSKDASCVEVCPVDCIHPMPDDPNFLRVAHLHIDPQECISCSACVAACPVGACVEDDDLPQEWTLYKERNAAYFRKDKS
jgi:ferredoxin